ncbi:MAG: leucine-rich repeat protein, partial [Erysipelotrichaceae bacterium]|nr:leucine-rich repeat protein [Erysipelotrichaceae bacterium]
SIQIPESVTLIGSYAFSECAGLTEVSVPGSVAKIDTYAFYKCTNLTDVTLNEGLSQLQGFAFSECTALEEIKMPVSLGYVGDHAFIGCKNLKNVSLQEGLGTIFAYAFANCTSLEEIHLPDSITKMGYRVFMDDTALKTVNYPKNYSTSIDGYGAVNYEYGQLFYGCTSLETVIIPDGTQKIADHSFRNSGISRILIPRSVTSIGNYAFDGCTKLTDVYYQLDEENWNNISIGSANDILSRVTMHYNTGTVDPAELVPVISASYNELIPVGTEVKFKGSAAASDSVISSWTWDFGDEHTEAGKSVVHTFETGGDYPVTLTIKDILGRQYSSTADYKAIDFNAENQGYTWIRWSVINGTDNSAVSGAEISLGTSEGEELYRFTSDSSGLAEKIIPEGRYQVTVIRQNYMPRSFEFEFEGGICERTLPMYQASILTGNITVRELTYDEIIAAGIDISAAGNGQVYAFKTQMFFKAGLKEYEIDFEFIKDPDGKILKKPEKVKLWIKAPDTEPDDDPDHPLGPGTYMPIPGGGYYIIAYPMTEKFALILTGEAHWLKEMFQVQLAVANPSFGSALDDISAELQLPAGMSLAEMTWGEQSAEQVIGMLMPGQSANTSWYIRGDAEGDYNIKAKVTGMDLEFNEAFEQNFETTDPIHVYAGSALHMTISCPDVAEFGKEYTVKYILENVSDKPIYDLTFGIASAEQYKIIGYGNQQAWLPIEDCDFGDEFTRQVDVLAPGGQIEMDITTTIWFFSALELVEFTKVGKFVDIVYYLDNVSQMTLTGSTTEIPYEFVVERTERDSFIDFAIDIIAEEVMGDLFPSANLGGTIIEIVGDKLGLESWMIKGAKTLLKLWKGSTNYTMTVSIDDGLGNENSIENDVVRITSGNGIEAIVSALNGTGFKISARELSIEAKTIGSTRIKIGIEDECG